MAICDKVVFHIAQLHCNLVRIQNMTRDPNHKAALDALAKDSARMIDHAKELLLTTRDADFAEPAPIHRNSWEFQFLKVGECLVADASVAPTLRASASAYGKRNGVQFSVKKQKDGTVRCYRTA